MNDHYNRHDQGANVRYTIGALVDESVGYVDCSAIALRYDASSTCQVVLRAHQSTDR